MNIEFTLTAGSKGRLYPWKTLMQDITMVAMLPKASLFPGGGGASAQFSSQTEIDLQIKLLDKTKRKANY